MICPFCGKELKLEVYESGVRGGVGRCIMFCDNDECEVKPCTAMGTPSRVIEEASYFGKINIAKE